METPNSTTIKKENNGNVIITSESNIYSVKSNSRLTKSNDGVIVKDDDDNIYDFKVATVLEVERADGTTILINDVNTLFDEFNEFFFFDLAGVTPVGGLVAFEVTMNLVGGNNPINHNLGKNVIAFNVKDGNDFVATTGSIVDNNNFIINLAGGAINNAKIIFIYIN